MDELERIFCDSGLNIKYKVEPATHENMRNNSIKSPIVLHFSGHGIKNEWKYLGNQYALNREKGDILLLEDEEGMADFLFEEELKKFMQTSKSQSQSFELVFVSSCTSEFAGWIFLNAGAKHVICIREGCEVKDDCSVRFSEVFYWYFFVENMSVCEAFELTIEDIKKKFSEKDADMYMLMKNTS